MASITRSCARHQASPAFAPVAARVGRALLCWLVVVISGCNHVFYQPDHVDYGNPAEVGLRYSARVWDTEDGERLQAWVIESEPPRRGVVLHFHGNAENRTSHFHFVSWLARRGYDVVVFDYRGYDGSSGTPGREGLYRDARRALAAVCASFSGPRFLLAQSLGGAVLVPALADSPDQSCYRAVVIDSSFASYRGMAEAKLEDFGVPAFLRAPLRYLVGIAHEPSSAAPRVTVPALVLHGDADPVVPIEQGRRLFDALGSLDKDFVVIPAAGHTAAFAHDSSPYEAIAASFFERQAGAAAE